MLTRVQRQELGTPGLDWVVSATEREMLEYLGSEVPCPRCGGTLRQESRRPPPTLTDDYGHTYSNVRALVVELYQRGTLGAVGASRRATRSGRHSAA